MQKLSKAQQILLSAVKENNVGKMLIKHRSGTLMGGCETFLDSKKYVNFNTIGALLDRGLIKYTNVVEGSDFNDSMIGQLVTRLVLA